MATKKKAAEAEGTKTEQSDESALDKRSRERSEEAEARIKRGNRRAEKAEAEDPADREERIREGMVFDDLAADQDDPRRRLKVLALEGDQVLVENLSSYHHSRIRADRLLSEAFQRSV